MTVADKQKPDAGPASIEVWPAVAKESEDTAKQRAHTDFEPTESDGHVVVDSDSVDAKTTVTAAMIVGLLFLPALVLLSTVMILDNENNENDCRSLRSWEGAGTVEFDGETFDLYVFDQEDFVENEHHSPSSGDPACNILNDRDVNDAFRYHVGVKMSQRGQMVHLHCYGGMDNCDVAAETNGESWAELRELRDFSYELQGYATYRDGGWSSDGELVIAVAPGFSIAYVDVSLNGNPETFEVGIRLVPIGLLVGFVYAKKTQNADFLRGLWVLPKLAISLLPGADMSRLRQKNSK